MRNLALILLVLTACHGAPTEPKFDSTGTLSGRVVFAESKTPVSGARVVVRLVPNGKDLETFTDAAGNYLVRDLVGGQYVVSIFAPGSTQLAYLRALQLGAPASVLDVEISTQHCVTIDGRVTARTTDAPIAGAVVTFLNHSATSDANGFYVLSLGCPPIPDGVNHTWSVVHPAYKPREFPMPVPSYSTTLDVVLDPL